MTTGLSLVLSVLLFTSVADSRLSWLLLMGTALSLEMGKILSISTHLRIISALLIAVSVLGSAGGLSRALAVSDIAVQEKRIERQAIDSRIDQIHTTLAQNNAAIDRYIALDRISSNVLPLQQQNAQLSQQLAQLNEQRAQLGTVDVPQMTAALNLLATLLMVPVDWVKAVVVLLLAGLLDALTVSFIREGILEKPAGELPFTPEPPEEKQPLPQTDAPVAPVAQGVAPFAPVDAPANVTAMDDSYPAFKRMMNQLRDKGDSVPSQRACIRDLGLRDRQVRGFFQRLQEDGVIVKRGGQFEWFKSGHKVMRQVSMI